MRQNGRIHRKQKENLKRGVNMKKNNTGHFGAFQRGLFPQTFPQAENGGETRQEQ